MPKRYGDSCARCHLAKSAYLIKALQCTHNKKAAEMLGITFRSLRYRLGKLNIEEQG